MRISTRQILEVIRSLPDVDNYPYEKIRVVFMPPTVLEDIEDLPMNVPLREIFFHKFHGEWCYDLQS